MEDGLVAKVKSVRPSIVAIGFKLSVDKVTIVGSGFSVGAHGEVLSAAHLYNGMTDVAKRQLVGMVMTAQDPGGLEHYRWLPLKLLKKDDLLDLVIFKFDVYEQTLLKPLKIGDAKTQEPGESVYFIGFPYAAQLMNEGYGITLVLNQGIISNVKRKGTDPLHPLDWFIIDAISNPGNSGCPLINLKTNEVVGVMLTSFRTPSKINPQLDIKEPMHIAGARPINLAEELLKEL